MAKNKVKFGLKNVYVFKATETTDPVTGEITTSYGSPIKWDGAVNLTLDPAGSEDSNFDADDMVYYVVQGQNTGYTGTFESALVPTEVLTDLLGFVADDDDVLVESKDDVRSYFAMTFEVNGDKAARRYVLYRCMLGRMSINGATITSDSAPTPQTDSVNITITPRPDDGLVKCRTGANTSDATFNAWNSSVYVPSTVSGKIALDKSTVAMNVGDTLIIAVAYNNDALITNATISETDPDSAATIDFADASKKYISISADAVGTASFSVESGTVESGVCTVTVSA